MRASGPQEPSSTALPLSETDGASGIALISTTEEKVGSQSTASVVPEKEVSLDSALGPGTVLESGSGRVVDGAGAGAASTPV